MMLNDLMAAPTPIKSEINCTELKKENLKFHNVADEVLAVYSMCQNGESNIQGIICNTQKRKKKTPPKKNPTQPTNHHIYSNEPLEDLKSKSIASDGSIQGFVVLSTQVPVSIQRQHIQTKKLSNAKLFKGPTMLHRHGETESYRKIFCHIIKLVFHLVIKSASTKKNNLQKQFTMPFGIEYNFFAQNTTMTTWRYHKDKEGRGIKEREYILVVSFIFVYEGIIIADDPLSFDSKQKI